MKLKGRGYSLSRLGVLISDFGPTTGQNDIIRLYLAIKVSFRVTYKKYIFL